jgi:probable F420-dependent oxidoreductase
MTDCGVFIFPTDYSMQPIELAVECEERGFESFWVPEHTHIPASRKTPWPGGGDLPKEYWHTHDPFLALTAAAAVTKRLKLGTGICLVIERDPIVMAKEVASLDFISNGRFIFGIGGGWNVEEMEDHGTPFKRRWKVLKERVLAMKEIWNNEAAEFHGEFVNFGPLWSYPKPVQKGGPPIVLGSNTRKALDRVVEYCDGWLPINFPGRDLAGELKALREAASKAGRKFESISLSLFGLPGDDAVAHKMVDLGFQRLIFGLPSAGKDVIMPLLDRYAKIQEKLR